MAGLLGFYTFFCLRFGVFSGSRHEGERVVCRLGVGGTKITNERHNAEPIPVTTVRGFLAFVTVMRLKTSLLAGLWD